MTENDEAYLYQLQARLTSLQETVRGLQRVGGSEGRGKRFIGKVIDGGSKPTSVPAYFLVNPVTVTATEAEGAPVSRAVNTSISLPVLVLGPNVPTTDDELDCFWSGSRAVARFKTPGGGGGPTGVLMGCVCATPPISLTLTATGCTGVIDSCTIDYGTTPSGFVSQMGANAYLSTSTFTDDLGYDYYWYVNCFSSLIKLSRAYPNYFLGTYYIDSVMYSWTIGISGNTCSPFSLTNGTIFFGGPGGCSATLTG